MGILELPSVHMHWADRWGLREKQTQIHVTGPIILEPLWMPTDSSIVDELKLLDEPEPEPQPWFTVRCAVCDKEIEFYLTVGLADFNPFNATVMVVQCEQCATRWAAILPPVTVTEADKLNLQEAEVIDGNTN